MSEPRKVVYQKIGAASGFAAPILAFICIAIAIVSYSPFSWTNNALSDLGVASGITSVVFNFGVYTSGLMSLSFAVFGLFYYFGKTGIGKVGAGFFAAANLALMAIGVFNESFSPTHYIVSVAFFTLMPIALFILTCAFYLNHQPKMAAFTVAVAFAAALPWLMLFAVNYVPNVAIPESLSGIAVSVWAVVVARKILQSPTT